jgi:hypothetical protein
MCRSTDQNVFVPTLADDTCNLTDEGQEDMLRYSITSGELQRELAGWITEIQEAGMDGRYYGEALDSSAIEKHLRTLACLSIRLQKEATVCNRDFLV